MRCQRRSSVVPAVLAAARIAGTSLLIALVVRIPRGEAVRSPVGHHWNQGPVNKIGQQDDEGPLYLTPYLVKGKAHVARERSRVGNIPGSPDLESYSGFITVRELQRNHLFFWFFPAMKRFSSRPTPPLVMWLQGGPGSSSLLGLLVEHGPLRVSPEGTAGFRRDTWAKEVSVVYVDQPVGTGFSHIQGGRRAKEAREDGERGGVGGEGAHSSTGSGGGGRRGGPFCTNAGDAAGDLYEFLGQFCVLFPECHRADFYVAAESYAAKFALALASMLRMIHDDDSLPQLKGVILASPFVDPANQVDNSELLHQTGFLTSTQAALMWERYNQVTQLIRRENYTAARDLLDAVMDGDPSVTLFGNMTGLRQAFDLELTHPPAVFSGYEAFVERPEVRAAVHVGRRLRFLADSETVQHAMYADLLVSYKHHLAELLDHGDIKVLLYCGQRDLLVPISSVERFMKTVAWKGQSEYATIPRQPWRMRTDRVLGYYRHLYNYTEVLVRGAGHVVAYDKPREVLELVYRFIFDTPLDASR
ncbi:putative serine carboxypeptidase CPVL isoform X1 [Haemaphysalis longicornis]